jgi:hypothetical protein
MAFKLLGSLNDTSFKTMINVWLAVNRKANSAASKPPKKGGKKHV